MPVFFVHDPALGIITPLDRKYHVRDIPPTSELEEINRIHPKVDAPANDYRQQHSVSHQYEEQQGRKGTVADYMSHPVLSISHHRSLQDAWNEMNKYEIHHLAIVDDQGLLVGMLTEKLMLNDRMAYEGDAASQVTLKRFCQDQVLSTNSSASIEELAVGLLELGLSGVPVTDNGIVTGMITRSDVLKVFLTQKHVSTEA